MRGSDASDEKHLLERIRAGDPEAFVQVFQRYHDALLRFARAGLHGAAEAEDVVQDVFLRLWRDRSQLTVDRSLRAYLLAAVRNRIIDGVRRQAVVERSAELQVVAGGGGDQAPVWPADPAELSELDAAIRACVAALPERCRTAFLLCRQQDLTYAEAAAVMGVTAATVKTQMARALAALRAAIEPFLPFVVFSLHRLVA